MKVNFVGFWPQFDIHNNFIINLLREKYDVEVSDEPDYLFYSVFSDDYLKYDCIRIFYTGENVFPDFNLCDYAMGFDYLNFADRYLRFPIYMLNQDKLQTENTEDVLTKVYNKSKFTEDILKEKKEFCSFVYSNYKADDIRKLTFELISQYKRVNSGGKYLNNIGGPVKSKIQFEEKHKFSIAIENGSHCGYTTEKIMESFAAKTIPIYWGDPEIEKVINPKAFVNANNYTNKELLCRIRELDSDDDKYLAMLREPAFLDEDHVKKMLEGLRSFLFHIVEQPYTTAFRRNRTFWGNKYERNFRMMVPYKKVLTTAELIYVKLREAGMRIGHKIS